MKVAYFSPFLPDPSGISDFSEELLIELKKYVNIDIFSRIEPTSECITKEFKRYKISDIDDESIRSKYDLLVFQAGNNVRFHKEIMDVFMKYSGILEIHDFAMHHYLAEDTYVKGDYDKYIRIMEYCHGKMGKKTAEDFLDGRINAPWENQSQRYTVNKHFIDNAKAIIVHSDMAKQMVLAIRPKVPVINIPLHTTEIIDNPEKYKLECRRKLGINQEIPVFGSFGYANRAKRIIQILTALSIIKTEYNLDFIYYIVGKVEDKSIIKLIKKLKLKKNVKVLGYVELDEFKEYMGACDICFNLRYPTQGESSASLHRIIGMGKPVLVTNVGTFEEYPDDIVYKICHDDHEVMDIVDCIVPLLKDKDKIEECSKRSIEYAKDKFDISKNALKYYNFYNTVVNEKFEEQDPIDRALNKAFEIKGEKDISVEYVKSLIHI